MVGLAGMTRCSTPNSISDGVLLERGAEEHLAGQEHDHEIRARVDVRGVALGRQLRHVRADLPGMVGEQRLPRRLVGRVERLQIRIERRLGVDHDVLAAGQPDDDVGPHAALGVGGRNRRLLLEIAALEHPGQLDHALQLQFAPASADARPLERVDQAAGLAAQFLAGRVERGDTLDERRARLGPAPFGFPDLAIHLIERSRKRREQALDRLLARVEVGGGFGARFAQPRFRQIEKRPVVGLERLGRQRLERLAQLRVGLLVKPGALGGEGPLALQLTAKMRQGRTAGEPSHARRRCQDQGQE